MDWGDDEPEATEPEPQGNSLFSKFATRFGPKKTSMIIWSNGTAEQVFFQPGLIPQKSDDNAIAIEPHEMENEQDDVEGDVDSNGSEEIDRGLGQDQYRSQ